MHESNVEITKVVSLVQNGGKLADKVIRLETTKLFDSVRDC